MTSLTVIRGDTRELTVTVSDAAGLAYDLTGADIWFTARGLVSKRLGDGITSAAPQTGVAVISISPADTSSAPPHRAAYPFDVQIKLADGSVRTPIRGLFIVLPDVTTQTT
jgi:hypothetical protein